MTLQVALDMSQGWLFGDANIVRRARRSRRADYEVAEIPNSKRRCPNEVLVFAGRDDGAGILLSVYLPVRSRDGLDAVLPSSSVEALVF